jgi:hypothetical protein
LNLDVAVEGSMHLLAEVMIVVCFIQIGNYTVDVKASPLLFDVIVEASKMVSVVVIISFFFFYVKL